jgi:hypothetical protein
LSTEFTTGLCSPAQEQDSLLLNILHKIDCENDSPDVRRARPEYQMLLEGYGQQSFVPEIVNSSITSTGESQANTHGIR